MDSRGGLSSVTKLDLSNNGLTSEHGRMADGEADAVFMYVVVVRVKDKCSHVFRVLQRIRCKGSAGMRWYAV